MSPSSRGRGLKLYNAGQEYFRSCHPLHEGVDWNTNMILMNSFKIHRPLHEGVDWNLSGWSLLPSSNRRPLHEGVDWNKTGRYELWRVESIALFTRAWIEIPIFDTENGKSFSRPLHEGVDWNTSRFIFYIITGCRPLHEGVDWNATLIISLLGKLLLLIIANQVIRESHW